MSAVVKFPTTDAATETEPVVLIQPVDVLTIFNQAEVNSGKEAGAITAEVKKWIIDEAKRLGWGRAVFIGNQCMLELKPVKKAPAETVGHRNSSGASDKSVLTNLIQESNTNKYWT